MALREVDALTMLRAFIQSQCDGSQKLAASKLGCTPQFVSLMVNGLKSIPDAMLPKLGARRVTVAEK